MLPFRPGAILSVLCVSFALTFVLPLPALAATSPALGGAATFGVLGGTYTNTAAGTTINGDVGFTTAPAMVPAGIHPTYGAGAATNLARIDTLTALGQLDIQPCTFTFAPGAIDLSSDITHGPVGVYTPGVYCATGAMNIGGPLVLSGNGTFIFRPTGALNSTAGAIVSTPSGSACQIFWTPGAATTLVANTTFIGSIVDNGTAITVGANTTVAGRLLSLGAGTVTTDTNTITVPTCLNVTKSVINDDGAAAVSADFTLHVTSGGLDVPGSPLAGAAAPGTVLSLPAGAYNVSEDANVLYAPTFSGDCAANGDVTLSLGDSADCVVTNNDIAATITVVKLVINDNGGTKVPGDFPLFVNGGAVLTGITNPFPAPAAYTITETPKAGYTRSFSGDCSAAGVLNLTVNTAKVCIITNDDVVPAAPPALGGGFTGGGGGFSAPLPVLVAPLIDVVKVPAPLALPGGPGEVVYTYTVRNIGTVPMSNVTLVGDTCRPILLISGDTNEDALLDLNETWQHTCTTTLTATHTNTVVATGWANGLSATDIASATVVVSLPLVPPLIHVVKIPNPLALPVGGGAVTYTEIVTNPGTVPLRNVVLTDDKCSPLRRLSGDTNKNSLLDPKEKWIYTCRSILNQTTTNTAIVSGIGNGIMVRDFAIVTVLVPTPSIAVPSIPSDVTTPTVSTPPPAQPVPPRVPKLPKTGLPPVAQSMVALPAVLRIPVIAVDALIEKVGLTKDGSMAIPKDPLHLGWYAMGPRPGQTGSAVIAGHLNWLGGADGVLMDLHKVKPGDTFAVEDADGQLVHFVVRETKLYDADADGTEVFVSTDGKAHLNIVTCAGVWRKTDQQYTKRLVVFTDKVEKET